MFKPSHLKKSIVAAAAALTLGGGMIAASAPAEAGHRYGYYGHHYGYRPNTGAVAAGVIGGLALGALAAQSYRAPAYAPVGYYGRPVAYGRRCFVERRVRINRFGERVVRHVRICR